MIAADLVRAGIVLLMLLVQSRQWAGLIYLLLFAQTTMSAFLSRPAARWSPISRMAGICWRPTRCPPPPGRSLWRSGPPWEEW